MCAWRAGGEQRQGSRFFLSLPTSPTTRHFVPSASTNTTTTTSSRSPFSLPLHGRQRQKPAVELRIASQTLPVFHSPSNSSTHSRSPSLPIHSLEASFRASQTHQQYNQNPTIKSANFTHALSTQQAAQLTSSDTSENQIPSPDISPAISRVKLRCVPISTRNKIQSLHRANKITERRAFIPHPTI